MVFLSDDAFFNKYLICIVVKVILIASLAILLSAIPWGSCCYETRERTSRFENKLWLTNMVGRLCQRQLTWSGQGDLIASSNNKTLRIFLKLLLSPSVLPCYFMSDLCFCSVMLSKFFPQNWCRYKSWKSQIFIKLLRASVSSRDRNKKVS